MAGIERSLLVADTIGWAVCALVTKSFAILAASETRRNGVSNRGRWSRRWGWRRSWRCLNGVLWMNVRAFSRFVEFAVATAGFVLELAVSLLAVSGAALFRAGSLVIDR